MGHRANFVLIRDGAASAYYDQWAALGSTYAFAGGPDDASAMTEIAEPVSELMDWAFAEGGYLLDYDEHTAIVFGYPAPNEPDLAETDDLTGADLAHANEISEALERGPLQFLELQKVGEIPHKASS